MKINVFKNSNKNLLKILLVYLLSNLHFSVFAGPQKIFIKSCYDGDTCTSISGEKIRLACIDTPEIRGKKAATEKALFVRDYLNELISGKEIKIRRITYDRYGRTVAELYKDKKNVQKHLFDLGLAKIYTKYANQCKWSRNYLIN